LADAKGIGSFLLGVLHAVYKAEAQLHDLPLPGGQLLHGAPEGGALGGLLQLQAHKVFIAAQHVREQQLVAIREQLRQYNATVGAGTSAADTGVLLADVLEKSLERNRQLAEYADRAAEAGRVCERQYDELTR
jgi:hypothetical protein